MSNVNLWWLNDESQQVLNKGYLLRGESVHDAIHRICSAAAKYYEGTKYEKDAYNKFKRNVENGWQSFSSPIWSNMGTSRGLPISCYNVNIGDSIDSITRKQSEVIKQTQKGGKYVTASL